MRIHYFIHITGSDPGISGVPRVVKNLGRQLVASEGVDIIPVCWSVAKQAVVHAPQSHLKNFARHGGPELRPSPAAGEPVLFECGDWLMFAEVPHLGSNDRDFPSVSIIEPVGYARRLGVRTAAILHDIMPLSHGGSGDRRMFVDMLPNAGANSADRELDRLRFTVYALAMVNVDLVLPVSQTSGTILADWLLAHGCLMERLPPIRPILLPEEISRVERVLPRLAPAPLAKPIEFLSVGTVCAHKNQLSAMMAFSRLVARRPELDLRFHVVGSVTSDCAAPASLLAKRSGGRILLHGNLSDAALGDLWSRAHASVFVSLAEGFGLPAAESLWHGKPCLCSNEGSIAEIARGGGCLTVDPRSLAEIEAGFEALAADASTYGALLKQLAARDMRRWSDYAAAVTSELAASSHPRAASGPFSVAAPAIVPPQAPEPAEPPTSRFVISVDDLKVREEYDGRDGRPSLRQDSGLEYRRESHASIPPRALFYGPYVSLLPGRYAFIFDGEIDGELRLAFESGQGKLEAVALTSFAAPVTISVPEAVERFEIIGKKTESLSLLTLRSIGVEFQEISPSSAAEDTSSGAPVRDDDWVGLSLPHVLEAAKLAVPKAFHKEGRNRLIVGSGLAFDREAHADVHEKTLFFGPYFHFEPGHYSLRFHGKLEGPLRLRINHRQGALHESIVTSFDQPIRIVLESPANKLEVVGERTGETQAMTLASLEIDRILPGLDPSA